MLSVLLGLCAVITACSESDCSIGGRPAARFNFLDTESLEQVSLFDSLTITSLGTDSVLLNKGKALKYVALPLSYVATETTYILQYTETEHDTIWLEHENTPHFISMDCGVDMFYTIKNIRYTTWVLDSIVIRNADINDTEKENFQILYTTTPAAE